MRKSEPAGIREDELGWLSVGVLRGVLVGAVFSEI